jgi:hypothetical protein
MNSYGDYYILGMRVVEVIVPPHLTVFGVTNVRYGIVSEIPVFILISLICATLPTQLISHHYLTQLCSW